VGGGFGAKMSPSPEEILTGWLARHLARPMRWTPAPRTCSPWATVGPRSSG
jgi:CO/xanthine dehydrogenase Mo-binding subunit